MPGLTGSVEWLQILFIIMDWTFEQWEDILI